MTTLKVAIDFEALALVKKAFLVYCRDIHDSPLRYEGLSFGESALSYGVDEKIFLQRRNEFFRLYPELITLAPGAVETVNLLRQNHDDNIVLVTDYPDTYVDVIRTFIEKQFSGWRPAIFCDKLPLTELTGDKSLANLEIYSFLDNNPGLAREILLQESVSKAQICACLGIDVLVDTNPVSAQDAALMSIAVCMVARPWNLSQKPKLVLPIPGWKELLVQTRILAREKK